MSKRKPAAALKASEPARKVRAFYRKRKPLVLDVLGKFRGHERLTDANLNLLQFYLWAHLRDSDREMKRRGLGDGREVYLQVAYPVV